MFCSIWGHIQKLSFRFIACLLTLGTLSACGSGGGSDAGENGAVDTLPPTVVSVLPLNNTNDVQPDVVISATFSELLDCNTVTATSFTVTGGSAVTGNVSCNGAVASFSPMSTLNNSASYTASLTTDIKDRAGNALASTYTWNFNTVAASGPDTTSPHVVATQPAEQSTGALRDGVIKVTFSEPVDCEYLSFSLFDGQSYLGGHINCVDELITFTPSDVLAGNTEHAIIITGNLRDYAGNRMGDDYVGHFTTAAELGVTVTSPANQQNNVLIDAVITATFVTPINCATLDFKVWVSDGNIPGNVNCNGNSATFTPTIPFVYSSSYSAGITAAVRSQSNQPLLGRDYVWSFQTVEPPDTIPPTVSSTTPEMDDVKVIYHNTTLSVTFSEAINCATLSNTTFILADSNGAVTGSVSCSGNTATFTAGADLALETLYTATITTGAQDMAGNPMAADHVWSFTTRGASTPIAITSNSFDLYLVNDDGTDWATLASSEASEDFAGFSPTGRVIYTKVRNISGIYLSSIYSVKMDGTDTIPLVEETTTPKAVMGVTPSGRVIYTLRVNGQDDLFSIKDDGTGQVTLSASPDHRESVNISQKGPYSGLISGGITASDKVVFNKVTISTGKSDVYIINADGTGQIPLTSTTTASEALVSLLPGGKLFYSVTPDVGSLYSVIVDEDGANAITLDLATGGLFGYSAGSVITLGSPVVGQLALFSVSIPGGTTTELVRKNNQTSSRLVFKGVSGNRVIYHSDQSGPINLYSAQIGVESSESLLGTGVFGHVGANGFISYSADGDMYGINVNGLDAATLAAQAGLLEVSRAVLPDGRVVFERQRSGQCNDLYIVNADGNGEVTLDDTLPCKYNVSVSRAGRVIYQASDAGVMKLYSVKPDGSDKVLLYGGNTYSYDVF